MNKQDIINGVAEYIRNKQQNKTWEAGKDFVNYAGPHFDEREITDAVSVLLDGRLVKIGRAHV